MSALVDGLNHMAGNWAGYVFHVTWQASVLGVVVLVVVRFGRRLDSHLRYALLLLALAKFLVPPFAAVPWGLFSQVHSASMLSVSQRQHNPTPRRTETPGDVASADDSVAMKNVPRQVRARRDVAVDLAVAGSGDAVRLPAETPQSSGAKVTAGAGDFWTVMRNVEWWGWFLLVHVAGSCVMALWIVRQTGHLARLSSEASEVGSGPLHATLHSVSPQLGLRRRVRLLVSGEAVAPMAFGLIRPVVLLPRDFVNRLSAAEQKAILAHELAHHGRWDQVVLWAQAILLCVWWFNPLIWLLNRAVRRCREECCDDRILHGELAAREVYSTTLVRIAEYLCHHPTKRTTAWFAPRMHPLGARVSRVMDRTLSRSGGLSIRGLLAVALVAILVLPGLDHGPSASAAPEGQRNGLDLYGDPLPDGAIARLGTVRFRQPRQNEQVAFIGNGASFVTVYENAIRIWDRNNGRIIREIETGERTIRTFAVSRDGAQLATLSERFNRQPNARDAALEIRSLPSGDRMLAKVWDDRIPDRGICMAFTPDGTTLAIAGGDRGDTLWLFDVASGDEKLKYTVPVSSIQSVAFSPDAQVIAMAGRRGILLWGWRCEAEPVRLDHPRSRGAMAVEFSPDGKLLATLTDDNNGLRVWDVESKQLMRRFDADDSRYYGYAIKFTSDGRYLIAPGDWPRHGVEVWDVATGQLTKRLRRGSLSVRCVSLTPDDQWLVAAGGDAMQVWHLPEDQHLGDLFVGHDAGTWEIEYLRDGESVATASMDGTVRIWDAGLGRQRQIMRHQKAVRSVTFSPDGRYAATSGMDDVVALWDVASGRRVYTLPGHGELGGSRDVRFSADGNRLLSWGDDYYVRAWDVETGKAQFENAIRPSGVKFVESDDGSVRLDGGPFGGMVIPRCAEFTPDGKELALLLNGVFYVFDVESGKELRKLQPDDRLDEAVLSPDGTFLFTKELSQVRDPTIRPQPPGMESWVTVVRIRDFESLEITGVIALPGRSHLFLAISPTGKYLAVYGSDMMDRGDTSRWISIIRVDNGREYARVTGFENQPYRLVFSPDEKHLVSSHADTTILVWDIDHFRLPGG